MQKKLADRALVNVRWAAFLVAAGLLGAPVASAIPYTWEGDGDDATGTGVPTPDAGEITAGEKPFKLWTAANNWSPEAVPGVADTVTFGTPLLSGAVNVAYNTPITVGAIVVNDVPLADYEFEAYGAGKLTLAAGGSITLGNDTAAIPFRGMIDLAGSASFIGGATASSFNFSNATVNGLTAGTTLTVNPNSGTGSMIGKVTGPINLVRSSIAGALTFSGQSTYTGSTSISGSTTIASVNYALPATTVLTVGSGATAGTLRLDNNSALTIAGLVNGGTAATNGINANATTGVRSLVTVHATQYSSFNGRLGAASAGSQYMDFAKSGPAAFTLANSVHTITGSVSVLGGTLEVEGAGNFSNASGVAINGGRLMWGSTASLTRPITLTAGTIGGTGSIGAAVSVGANSTISPGGTVDGSGVLSETIATQNYTAGLTFAPAGKYHYDVDASTNDLLNVTGALNLTSTAASPFQIDVTGTGLTPGAAYVRNIATSSVAIANFSADKFAVGGSGAGSVSLLNPTTLQLSFTAQQSIYWDTNLTASGAGATPTGNWDGAAVNFNTDSTGGAAGSTTAATLAYHVVNFSAGADAINPYTVTLTGTQTALAVNVEEGNVTLTGGSLATGAIDVSTGASATVSSVLTGSPAGTFTKRGAGTLTLSSANSYTGLTTVSAGTLAYGASDVIATGDVLVSGSNAVLDLGASHSDTVGNVTLEGGGSITGTGTSTLSTAGTFELKNGSVSAILGGSGALNKSTADIVTLSAANSYAGATTITAGTLKYGVANAVPSGAGKGNVAVSGTLDLNGFSGTINGLSGAATGVIDNTAAGTASLTVGDTDQTSTYSGAIRNTGGALSLTKIGTGTLTLSGTSTYSGGTTVSGGTLQGTTASLQGAITNNAAVVFDQATNGTYSGTMTGSGTLTKLNAGTVTLSGANAYGGGTTVSAGTLRLVDSGTLGSGAVTNNSVLELSSTTALAVSNVISGTGAVTKSGAGTATLSGANSYGGGTTVATGTLVLANADATGGGAINVADGAIAQVQAGLPKAVTVTTLATNATGKFNVTNNSMVIKGMADSAVRTQLQAGYSGGTWNGATGIVSTSITSETSIGYATNAQLGNLTAFKGVSPLAGTDVLVKYTYAGDANLDGKVDIGDLGLLAGAWQQLTGKVWFDGDFTYDGAVDIGDLGLLAGNWQKGTAGNPNPPLMTFNEAMAQFSAFDGVVVPEPTGLALVGVAGLGLLRRSRRRSA